MYSLARPERQRVDMVRVLVLAFLSLLLCTCTTTAATLPTRYLRLLDNGRVEAPIILTPLQGDSSQGDDDRVLIVKATEDEPIPLAEIAQALSSGVKPMKRSPAQMHRLARNMPPQEKMYQISNIGDLPMFRFG